MEGWREGGERASQCRPPALSMTLLWNWRAAPEWNHFPLMLQDAGTYPGLSRLMKLN